VKRWGVVIALLLSLGVNIGLLATVALRRLPAAARPAAKPPLERVKRLADRLGLEGAIRQRFIAQQMQFFDQSSGLRADLEDIHRDLRREITRPQPDPQKIDALLAESEKAYHNLEQVMVNHVLDGRAMLDPAQERRFLDFVRRMRGGPFGLPRRLRAKPPAAGGEAAREDRPLPGGALPPSDPAP
jgi:hypothetical protein